MLSAKGVLFCEDRHKKSFPHPTLSNSLSTSFLTIADYLLNNQNRNKPLCLAIPTCPDLPFLLQTLLPKWWGWLEKKKKTKLPYSFDSLKQSLYIQNPWSQRNAEHWSHVIICESHSFITKMSFSNIITQHIKGRFEKESFNDWRTCVYKSTWWIFSF